MRVMNYKINYKINVNFERFIFWILEKYLSPCGNIMCSDLKFKWENTIT